MDSSYAICQGAGEDAKKGSNTFLQSRYRSSFFHLTLWGEDKARLRHTRHMRIRAKLEKGSAWCADKNAAQMQAEESQDAEQGILPVWKERCPKPEVKDVNPDV